MLNKDKKISSELRQKFLLEAIDETLPRYYFTRYQNKKAGSNVYRDETNLRLMIYFSLLRAHDFEGLRSKKMDEYYQISDNDDFLKVDCMHASDYTVRNRTAAEAIYLAKHKPVYAVKSHNTKNETVWRVKENLKDLSKVPSDDLHGLSDNECFELILKASSNSGSRSKR